MGTRSENWEEKSLEVLEEDKMKKLAHDIDTIKPIYLSFKQN